VDLPLLARKISQAADYKWETGGFVIYYKRLEKGTFEIPSISPADNSVEMTTDELVMLIAGIELSSIKRRPRFKLGIAPTFPA